MRDLMVFLDAQTRLGEEHGDGRGRHRRGRRRAESATGTNPRVATRRTRGCKASSARVESRGGRRDDGFIKVFARVGTKFKGRRRPLVQASI